MPDMKTMLNDFMVDKQRHLNIFWQEIQTRQGITCKSYWLCGVGGYFMGFFQPVLDAKASWPVPGL